MNKTKQILNKKLIGIKKMKKITLKIFFFIKDPDPNKSRSDIRHTGKHTMSSQEAIVGPPRL